MNRIVKFVAAKIAMPAAHPGKPASKPGADSGGFNLLLQNVGVAAHVAGPRPEVVTIARGRLDAHGDAKRDAQLGATDIEPPATSAKGGVPGTVPSVDDGLRFSAIAELVAPVLSDEETNDSGTDGGIVGDIGDGSEPLAPSAISALSFVSDPSMHRGQPTDVHVRAPEPPPVSAGATKGDVPTTALKAIKVQKAAPDAPVFTRSDEVDVFRNKPPTLDDQLAANRAVDDEAISPGVIVTVASRQTHFAPIVVRAQPVGDRDTRDLAPARADFDKRDLEIEGRSKIVVQERHDYETVGRPPQQADVRPADDGSVDTSGPGVSPAPPLPAGLPPAVLQDVGSAIAASADILAAEPAARPTLPRDVLPVTPAQGPVQGMEVRLDTPDHGTVHVRMTLSGKSLALRLSADQDETAHRLRNDHDELSRILHRAGYDADIVSTQPRPADSSPPSAQNTTSQAPANGGGASTQGQSGREQRQPQGGAPWQSADNHTSSQNSNDTTPPRDRPAGGLYV